MPSIAATPLVSVVIPVFDRAGVLGRAVRSVFAQSLQDFELLVVDDGSTDDPGAVVASFGDPRITLLRQPRSNAAVARNTGIRNARGRYVAFLDSDDEWLPGHLERRVRLLEDTGADGVAGAYTVSPSGEVRGLTPPAEPSRLGNWLFCEGGDLRCSTLCFRRDRLAEVLFDPGLRKHQDWDLCLRFARRFRMAVDTEPTVVVHATDRSRMSARTDHAATARFIARHREHLDNHATAHMLFCFIRMTWFIEGRTSAYHDYLGMLRELGPAAGPRLYVLARLLGMPGVDPFIRSYKSVKRLARSFARSPARGPGHGEGLVKGGQHLALFMPSLAGGGAERIMLTLAEAFAECGYRVDLVVTRAVGALAGEIPASVRLVDLGAKRIATSLPALVRYLRNDRPDALLSALAPANCIAVWARRLAGGATRLVLSEHNTLSQSTRGSCNRRERILPALMRRYYPNADAVVAVSAGVADDLAFTIGLERQRIEVIYNPVVTERLHRLAEVPIEHPWFGDSAPPVILGVGRLTAAKDFATLIRAFARLRKQRALRLLILGEGEERAGLEALVRRLGVGDDVAMPGFVINPYPYMKHASQFVLSSKWEGLPTVLIEAMACGTPVVSTDCPSGPAEILEGGKWGRLVPVGDETALAEAIGAALRVPGADARSRAAVFSPDRAVGRYLRLLFPEDENAG